MASRLLLASGSSLKEVADVLRHRSLDTTLIYAKLDTHSLSTVAPAVAGGGQMNTATTMQSFVEQFLEERRRLGFAARSTGCTLRSFAAYVDAQGLTGPLRIEVMAKWARCPKNASDDPVTWARRLTILRPFARWFRQFEPDSEVPDTSIFGSGFNAWRRISIRNRRSASCWPPPTACSRHCAGPPMKPCSACWRPPACGSPRRCICSIATLI